MRILVVSTMIYPVRPDLRYGGIERLVYLTAPELRRRGHEVCVVAPEGSVPLWGVERINSGPLGDFVESERWALTRYQHRLPEFDAILDYSHTHSAMIENDIPGIAFIWHDPYMMKPREPSYNIAALSQWQAQRFASLYGYEARVIDPHCGHVGIPRKRNNRFLVIGRIAPSKGPLEAIELCRELGAELDVVGTLGPGDSEEYLETVKQSCDGNIHYLGEVDESTKFDLLETCRALIYPVNYPRGTGEAHSHKSVEALLCGTPVIAYDTGALHEVIEHEVTGFLAHDREEFKHYMTQVDALNPATIGEKAASRWSVASTVDRLLDACKRVSGGERWGKPRTTRPTIIKSSAPSAIRRVQHALPAYPRQVRLDTINACNARCIPCHLNWQTRPKGQMEWELIERAVADMTGWPKPPEEIVPVNFGEFMLRKDWRDILELIETRLPNTRIALATNGSLLDDDVVTKLASVKTLKWLNFSVNAYFRETYEAFTGLNAETIDKIVVAAERIRLLRADIATCASMIFDTQFQTELERDLFVQFWRPKVSVVSINPAAYAGSPLKKPQIPVLTPCRSIFDGLVVLHDGKVVTGCCFDASGVLEVGDFNEQSLMEIWRGEKLKRLCDLHNSGRRQEIGLCASCTFA